MFRRLCAALGGALLLFAVGCTASDTNVTRGLPKAVDVSGTVELPDGKPLPGGTIIFVPKDNKPGYEVTGNVVNGKFKTSAWPHQYLIAFDRFVYDRNGNLQENKAIPLPPQYMKSKTSGLECEVKGEPLVLELKLKKG
jgi:hypothetical protein